MNPAWWRGRKVFLTGHTGFKGAWLCLLLHRLGAKISGYSLGPPTDPNLFELADVETIAASVRGDVRDLPSLTDALQKSQGQIVLHLAAQSLVRESYLDPIRTFSTNVIGTANLLQAVRTAGKSVAAVVIVTSDKCYEIHQTPRSYREDEPMGGHDPYSSSKACAELVTTSFRRSFFFDGPVAIASARAGNVIGGGDWAKDRLIPDIIRAFSASQSAIIRHPQAIRPWQLVLEPLAGYLQLAEKLVESGQPFAGAWNFGPGESDSRPVNWIADRLAQLWGGDARWGLSANAHPHEAPCLKLDAAKARSQLNWNPRTDLDTALVWIVQWYQAWQNGGDLRRISDQQIDRFLELPVRSA